MSIWFLWLLSMLLLPIHIILLHTILLLAHNTVELCLDSGRPSFQANFYNCNNNWMRSHPSLQIDRLLLLWIRRKSIDLEIGLFRISRVCMLFNSFRALRRILPRCVRWGQPKWKAKHFQVSTLDIEFNLLLKEMGPMICSLFLRKRAASMSNLTQLLISENSPKMFRFSLFAIRDPYTWTLVEVSLLSSIAASLVLVSASFCFYRLSKEEVVARSWL